MTHRNSPHAKKSNRRRVRGNNHHDPGQNNLITILMYIHIDENGVITLQDFQNMKSFSIVDDSNGYHLSELDSMSEPAEENHYWIDVATGDLY